jgi:polysaccharide export outer membrane protein
MNLKKTRNMINFVFQSTFKMNGYIKLLLLGFGFALLFSSCGINSNLMLKTPKGYVFDSIPMNPVTEYKIAPNDIVSFRLFANHGFKVIDLAAGTSISGEGGNAARQGIGGSFISYLVRYDSVVRLPMLGDIKLAGKTILQAETELEKVYSKFYVDPYVQIQIKNKRVIVFPGNGATAKVVNLENNNTSLLETLASVNGIPDRGKAKRIKIIRQVAGKKEVYLVDLSTIGSGLQYVNMIMQANDIIYVEPVPEISKGLVKEIAPIVSLISSAFLIYLTINNLR